MSESPTPDPGALPAAPNSERNEQLISSQTIIIAMTVIALALIIGGFLTKNWVIVSGSVGTIVGALATALTTPNGIAAAIRSSKVNS